MQSNFNYLSGYWNYLAELGKSAECSLKNNPETSIKRMEEIGHYIVHAIAQIENSTLPVNATYSEQCRILQRTIPLPSIIYDIFLALNSSPAYKEDAPVRLQLTFRLTTWFMQVYGNPAFLPISFQEPDDDTTEEEIHDAVDFPDTPAMHLSQNERRANSEQSAASLQLSEKEKAYLKRLQIRFEISLVSTLSYGHLQNGYPVLRSLTVVNTTDESLENITLTITATPEFSRTVTHHIACVPSHSKCDLSHLSLECNTEFLRKLETTQGVLHFELKKNEEILCTQDYSIHLLSSTTWQGITIYPELLAGFVTPEDTCVKNLITQAEIKNNLFFDGYQRQNPVKVKKQVQAIYEIVQDQKISCSQLPQNYETTGIAITIPDTVVKNQAGNSLDISILFASCLESVHLHPLIILTRSQVLAGVWLNESAFENAFDDDFIQLSEKMNEGEILLVDSFHPSVTFEEACSCAQHLLMENLESGEVLDVFRARETVFPFPSSENRPITQEKEKYSELSSEEAKIMLWESKLLDLGLGNTLINMRMTRSVLPLLSPKLDILEDKLTQGIEFLIKPIPQELSTEVFTLETLQNIGEKQTYIDADFQNHSLCSIYSSEELQKNLKNLYRKSRISLEENGANTLYLALGFLKWFETDKSEKARYAPITLIPVEIVRKYASNGYVIRIRDEESQINITLLEKLSQEFHISVNDIIAIPNDAYGLDIYTIFKTLQSAVSGFNRWEVVESACLGIFSFSQFVMWNDLHSRTNDLMENKLTHSFISGKLEWDAKPMALGRTVPEDNVYLPIPADSSQLYAIEAACSGKTFVLHGPPGTGKSQTITSMIANALAHGKRILFVAEKMAALEVVQNRLNKIGLGPFCLELHSNKAKKRDVLNKLKEITEIGKLSGAKNYQQIVADCRALRLELDVYATSLHRTRNCGESLYTVINRYEQSSMFPDICTFDSAFVSGVTSETLSRMDSLVEQLISAGKGIGHPQNHPLSFIHAQSYTQSVRYVLPDKTRSYSEHLTKIQRLLKGDSQLLFPQEHPTTFAEIATLISRVKRINALAGFFEVPMEKTYRICNRTLRSLIEEEDSLKNAPDVISIELPKNCTAKELNEREEKVQNIIDTARTVGSPAVNSLSFVTTTSSVNNDEVVKIAKEYSQILRNLSDNLHPLCQAFGFTETTTFGALEKLAEQFTCIAQWQQYPEPWADAVKPENFLKGVLKLAEDSLSLEEHYRQLHNVWTEEFFTQDIDAISAELNEINQKWALARTLGLNSIYKRLKPFMVGEIEKDDLSKNIASLKAYILTKNEVSRSFALYGDGLPSNDWSSVKRMALEALELNKEMHRLMDVPNVRATAGKIRDYDFILSSFVKNWKRALQLKSSLNTLLKIKETDGHNWLSLQLSASTALIEHIDQLQPWIHWNLTAEEAQKFELGSVISAYYEGYKHEEILSSYRKVVCRGLIESIVVSEAGDRTSKPAGELVRDLHDFYAVFKLVEPFEERKISQISKEILDTWELVEKSKSSLYELLTIKDSEKDNWIEDELERCSTLQTHIEEMKDWVTWNCVVEEASRLGLEPVVCAYQNGVEHDLIFGGYQKALYRALAISIIDSDSVLGQFSGAVFNEKIEQFKRLDTTLTNLTRKEIVALLSSQIPDFSRVATETSEINILQRAIRSNGRGISIRRLFEQIQNLLPRMCPCMLMSPISVAQYLTKNHELFDLVIFDEASQLPTWKALGTLLRGKEAIIVGDPNQMPPTSFFASASIDEEYCEIADLDSILDDCLALNMPSTHLLWHYRSRHESLIAFSNCKFYQNKLYTFPSSDERSSRVRLVHVDGFFERGKNRINTEEAKAVVGELKRRCYTPELAGQSVGVVTFNVSQQGVIEDLLDDLCVKDSKFAEWAFQSLEPLFVKNLENVQGDERDVILFSIGYGPDKDGKFSMNFGPLNRDGGWRRLNVAITRARSEMVIFATLRPEDIILSRTRAEGVVALKNFLEYAEGESLALADNSSNLRDVRHTEILHSIASMLKENGYDSDILVGHSRYRLDLGVIEKNNSDKYSLGILLDDEEYGAAKTTRDRELSQISVLQGLGWQTLRVWTMDWWDNRKREIQRILLTLKQIEDGVVLEQPIDEVENEVELPADSQCIPEPVLEEGCIKKMVYSSAELEPDTYEPEDFLNPENQPILVDKILRVISVEAPITEGLLTKRVVQSCGVSRSGAKIQKVFTTLYQDVLHLHVTMDGGVKIYWKDKEQEEGYCSFRVSGNDSSKRDSKDVPVIEAANAVVYAVTQSISLTDEGMVKEGARLLGYSRIGPTVASLMDEGIKKAVSSGFIVKSGNGNWILSKNKD